MPDSPDASRWLRRAIALAKENVEIHGGGPFGAVIVRGGELVAEAANCVTTTHDPTAHAEVLALRDAAAVVGHWRLLDCTLYVTLEPCVMCAGALVSARISTLVFGARDLRFGGVRSKFQIADAEVLNHRVAIVEGVLGAECTELMQAFFAKRR